MTSAHAIGVVCAVSLATAVFAQTQAPAKPKAAGAALSDTLMHHEQSMLEALSKRDFAGFQKMVAPGSWAIDENGPATIEDFLKQVKDPKANLQFEFKTSDMKVVDVDANARIVTYRLEQKGSFMGQPFPPIVYASTVWASHGGMWHAIFHQESTAAPPQGRK